MTNAVGVRLLSALRGSLPWAIDSNLLSWLLANGPTDAIIAQIPDVLNWLNVHEDDTDARGQFLEFLVKLTSEFDGLRRSAATQTMKWLKLPNHAHDTTVRSKLLDFLGDRVCEFDDLRLEAATQTAEWLNDHEADIHVRTQFLDFLLDVSRQLERRRLSAATQVSTHVGPQGLEVLVKFSAEFSKLRRSAADGTARWLALPNHRHDMAVRSKFLSFLADSLCRFNELLYKAASETATWLDDHTDDAHVRTQWLTFLTRIHHPDLASACEATLRWLEQHEAPIVAGALLKVAVDVGSMDLVCSALDWASRFLERRRWVKADQVVASSMSRPYEYLLRNSHLATEPEETKELLARAKHSIETWCLKNPTTTVIRAP